MTKAAVVQVIESITIIKSLAGLKVRLQLSIVVMKECFRVGEISLLTDLIANFRHLVEKFMARANSSKQT